MRHNTTFDCALHYAVSHERWCLAQLILRHVHLDAAADHVGAAFLHDRLPPPPATLQRGASQGAPRAESRGDGSPGGAADASDTGRKPLSKAERRRQKRVTVRVHPGCWTQDIRHSLSPWSVVGVEEHTSRIRRHDQLCCFAAMANHKISFVSGLLGPGTKRLAQCADED